MFQRKFGDKKPCDDNKIDKLTYNIINSVIDNKVVQFPPKICCDFLASSNRTTNNNCESCPVKLNALFHSGRPSILHFCCTLLGIQLDAYINIRSNATKQYKKTLEKEKFSQKQTLLDNANRM